MVADVEPLGSHKTYRCLAPTLHVLVNLGAGWEPMDGSCVWTQGHGGLLGGGGDCLRSGVKARVLAAGTVRHILTENETLVVIEVILFVWQMGKQMPKGEAMCLSPS